MSDVTRPVPNPVLLPPILFRPVGDVASCVRLLLETHGPKARWAVVPDGPMLILKTAGRSPV